MPVIPPAGSVGMYFRVLVTGKGYSDNIVGYHLLEVPTGQSLLSSPLAKGDNTLATLLPTGPANLTVSTWNSEAGEWTASTFGEAWSNAGLTIAPGQAAFRSSHARQPVCGDPGWGFVPCGNAPACRGSVDRF